MPPSRTNHPAPQLPPPPSTTNARYSRYRHQGTPSPWDSNPRGPNLASSPFASRNSSNRPEPRYCSGSSTGGLGTRAGSASRGARAYPEVDVNSTAVARQCGMQVLCNSSNVAVRRLEVTNVAGHVFNGIDAEQLERIQAEMWARFQAMLPTLPPGVGVSSANSLIITDALGETMTIHCSSIQTYDDVQRFLVTHFRGKIGEDRVKEGRYRIAGANDGILVKRGDWEKAFEERKHLVMSMLIEQVYLEELDGTCPKCDETELGTYVDQGWIVCRRCNGRCLPASDIRLEEKWSVVEGMQPDAEGAYFRHVVKTRVRLVEWWHRDDYERYLCEERKKRRRMNAEKSRFQELNN